MGITTTLTTLATAAATLLANGANAVLGDETPITVQNQDAAITIYIGGPAVTNTGATTGIRLLAGQSQAFTLLPSDSIYAIPASGTPNVVVMKGRQ